MIRDQQVGAGPPTLARVLRGRAIMDGDEAPDVWRKSKFSGNGDCVEWLMTRETVYVRSSQSRSGPIIPFRRSEWLAFIHGVKSGEADLRDDMSPDSAG
jgi:hypothetical protein